MKTPQILVTFSPTGQLQAETTGSNGARAVIPLPESQAYSTLHRLLRSQAIDAIQEAWIITQAHKNRRSYDDQLDNLMQRRAKMRAAKRTARILSDQLGEQPKPKPKTTKTIISSPLLATLGDDL